MEPFGEYLKKAREKKKLSLEQIASQTRIQETHLRALESEDFANLPAKVFAKGFVRAYAKALDLDEEETLQRFLETSCSFYEQIQPEPPHVQVRLEVAHQSIVNWKLVGIVAAVIAIGALWSWLPQQQEAPIALSEPEISSPQEPIPPAFSPEESVLPVTPVDSVLTQPSPPAPVPAAPMPKPIPPIEETTADVAHILEIEATQLTWVVVQSDQQTPNEALLQPGHRTTWKANKQFMLTLGNAAGVVIRLNGETQGPFGKPGQVVRDIRLRP